MKLSTKLSFIQEMYANKAKAIIENHDTSKTDEPLFLYIALQNIHGPQQAPRSYIRKYRNSGLVDTRIVASGNRVAVNSSDPKFNTSNSLQQW